MATIKLTISIPDYEDSEWNDFHDGIEEQMTNLRLEIREVLRRRFIRHFEVESEHEE